MMKWDEFKEKLLKQGDIQPSLNGSLLSLLAAARQASELADCSVKEQRFEQAYVYYLRAANTIILHAPKHRDFPSAKSSTISEYKNLSEVILEKLEDLTKDLQKQWDAPAPESEPDFNQDDEDPLIKPQKDQHLSSQHLSPLYQASDDSTAEHPSAPPAEDVLEAPLASSSSYPQNDNPAYTLSIASDESAKPSSSFPITPDMASSVADPFANLRISAYPKTKKYKGNEFSRKSILKQTSILESIDAVKRLRMPSDLPWVFLRHVDANTSKNIETCGFLLGQLSPTDEFVVTELYIPPQAGTADTVNVGSEGDEATLNYAISNHLCILGWIHTHPSQACFLSSVDLHTQFIYQATQSSFVGIVMAPSYPKNNIGFFSVTEKGLSILRDCSKDGFHQHSENEGLYTASKHVVLEDNRRTKVVDGR